MPEKGSMGHHTDRKAYGTRVIVGTILIDPGIIKTRLVKVVQDSIKKKTNYQAPNRKTVGDWIDDLVTARTIFFEQRGSSHHFFTYESAPHEGIQTIKGTDYIVRPNLPHYTQFTTVLTGRSHYRCAHCPHITDGKDALRSMKVHLYWEHDDDHFGVGAYLEGRPGVFKGNKDGKTVKGKRSKKSKVT